MTFYCRKRTRLCIQWVCKTYNGGCRLCRFLFFHCGFSDSLCVLQSKVCAHQKAIEREYYSAKSSMSLGLFIMFFGANQLLLNRGTLADVIGVIFMLTGLGSMWAGYKAYKHYVPLLAKENERENA